jgi:signal transduction histidine kinase
VTGPRRLLLVDVLVASAAFGVSAIALAGRAPVGRGLRSPDLAAYVLLAVYSAAVVVRRRLPVVAVIGGLVAGVAFAAAQYPPALTPVVLLPVYTAASTLSPRPSRVVLAAAVVLGYLGATFSPGPTDLGVPALLVSAWLLGNHEGTRRRYTAELEAKNRLLQQAQIELADRAVTEERLRIARELHDVVAHTMSVVAVHAGTGRMVAGTDPGAARQALATIETATRSALTEMRHMLGMLRGADAASTGARAPSPGLGDLDGLVAEVVGSGLTVEVRVEGDRRDLPTGVDLSAYRIVQEALTNVIRHAGRARATVTVRYADDAVTVDVEDDGSPRPAEAAGAPAPGGGGHGIMGMRERVAVFGGALDAGPRPDGGFRVTARLPYGETP